MFYRKKRTLKHDIHSDFRARLLSPLHTLLVGKLPKEFKIYNNKVKFKTEGSVSAIQASYLGEIEFHLINYAILNTLKQDMVFLDIGGHHGEFACVIGYELKSRKLNGSIITFEPDKILLTEDSCPGLKLAEQLLPRNGMRLTKQ